MTEIRGWFDEWGAVEPAQENKPPFPSEVRRNKRMDLLPNPRLPRSPRVRDRWARMRPRPSMFLKVRIEDVVQMDSFERRRFFDQWITTMRSYYGDGDIYQADHEIGHYTYKYEPRRAR